MVSALLLTACAGTGASLGDASNDDQAFLDELRDEFDLPGLAIAVADRDGVIFTGAAGSRRVGSGAALETTDPFHIGSVSKPITSTVVGVLVDQGEFDWETTVGELSAELMRDARPEYASITIGQLLSHTAGIPPFEEDEEFDAIPVAAGDARAQRLTFAQRVLTLEPVAAPGNAHVYSNAGYTIAAAAIEHRYQQDFAVLARRLVFAPLDLTSAGVGPPSLDDPDAPWGHALVEGEWQATDPRDGARVRRLILSAGDFHMNVVDLAHFGRAHLRALEGRPGLLRPGTAGRIHSVVMDGYGLGWNVRDNEDSHLGGLEGQHTALLLIHKSEARVFAIALNAETEETAVFGRLIARFRR